MEKAFFFDTYAMFEIAKGNKNYLDYACNIGIATTKLNLMELYYGMFVNFGKIIADQYYGKYREFCVEVSDDTIKSAMRFRAENRKKGLSYADCVGYILAAESKIKFLTGDKEFEQMPNVEYVK